MAPRCAAWVKWGGVGAIVLFLAAQFVPVKRSNPPVESEVPAPAEVRSILERSCFDCHSNETRWPWYSRVAPVSWWVSKHVERGRQSLNFSRWPAYDFESQDLLFRQIETEIENGTMPLASYLRGHPEARLSGKDREVLLEWVR